MANSLMKTVRQGWKWATSPGTKQRERYARHLKMSKVDPSVILLESYHGLSVSDSPLYVLRELMRTGRASEFTIYFTTRKMEEHQRKVDDLGLPVTLVDINSPLYPKVLATAKYIVNNSSLPTYFIKRDGQVHIETFHGTPLKTLGKQMRNGVESMFNAQHNFLHSTYITFPNDFARDMMMRDYNLTDLYTGKVAMVGYPRNDAFFDTEKIAAVRKQLGLDGKTVFAYMPTWRGTSANDVHSAEYAADLAGILEQIDKVLDDDQVFYVSIHSMIQDKVSVASYEHVFPFPAEFDTYDLLAASDVLITDYSSAMFDYSVTYKPIVLFLYDLEQYLQDRGLYLDIEELPFTKVYSTDELASCIESGSYARCDYRGTEYAASFLKYETSNDSARVLSLLFDEPDPSIPIIDCVGNRTRHWRVVHPSRQNTEGDVNAIAKSIDPEHEVAWLERAPFAGKNSFYLYSNYRDSFNYVFAVKAHAATRAQYALSLISPHMQKRFEEQEKKRVFGDLVIDSVRTDVFVAEVGCAIGATPDLLPVHVMSDERGAVLEFDGDRFELRKLLFAHKRQIVWMRDVEQAERDAGVVAVECNFLSDMRLALEDDPLRICLAFEAVDRETGRSALVMPVAKGVSKASDDAILPDCMPISIDAYGSDGGSVQRESGKDAITSDVAVPYIGGDYDSVYLLVTSKGDEIRHVKFGKLEHFSARCNEICFTAAVRKGVFVPHGVVIVYRSKVESIERSLPCEIAQRGGWLHVKSKFVPEELDLKPAVWDLYVEGDWAGQSRRIPISCSALFKLRLLTVNTQCDAGAGHIAFPYTRGRTRFLTFTYREKERFDTAAWRGKELLAFAEYAALRPYWTRKRVWLVFEKQCALAQDNGFHFFKYCMDNLSKEERKHIFFVVDRNSPDYENVLPYKEQVLDFLSYKHMLYSMVADIYVGSDAKTHLYGWRAKPNFVSNRISKHKILFLQHGVTALKKVDDVFGKKGITPMTYFLATSEAERDVVVENFGYQRMMVPILGFARWDTMFDKSNPRKPMVLLMPTWRPWLEHLDDEGFAESDYYRAYSELICNQELADFLEREDAVLKFFIHPKLSAVLSTFVAGNERIELVEQGSIALSELIMQCSALITDYSSVSWDVLQLDKPVVYYQFDKDLYLSAVGSYMDFDTELPGESCADVNSVVVALEDCASRGFTMTDSETKRAEKWQGKKDRRNCERIYRFLVDNGF